MNNLKRGLAVAAAAALPLSLAALPANAAPPPPLGVNPITDATEAAAEGYPIGSVIEVKSAVDGGGVRHTFKVVWVKKYKDPVGTLRVSVPTLADYRTDSDTEGAGESADAGEDVHFDVSSHGTVRWTQHKVFDGIDLDEGSDNVVSFNPRNPVSDPGDTFIRISAGVDGDGAKNTPFVYFYQPEGLPTSS